MVSAATTILLAFVASSEAFMSPRPHQSVSLARCWSPVVVRSTTEETPATSDLADVEIPTNLPSDCGMDYVPLATMLATGEFKEADQVRYHCVAIWTNEQTVFLTVTYTFVV